MRFVALVLALAWAFGAQAQTAGVITFTAKVTTGAGSVTPDLTWSTEPVATSCIASNGWSGTKAPAGNEILAPITSNRTYVLTCVFPGSQTATVSWIPPTQRTDGTPYTNPKAVRIFYSTTNPPPANATMVEVAVPATSRVISPLAIGTWHFQVKAVDMDDIESAGSLVASKAITTSSSFQSVAIAVKPRPNVPTGVIAN